MRVLMGAAPAAIGVLALAPASAFAIDYLSAQQVQQLMFAQADRFDARELAFDAAQLQRIEAASGVRARSARWSVHVARKGEATLGYVVIDQVIGKYELITYAVGLAPDGSVLQVEVMSYRESHGHEIRLPAWRRQFVGKTASAPIKVGEDIANISGATLSCTHVSDGVKRIVSVMDFARREGLLQ
ncbi:MAG TPA: FMN-binding protein [Burkholderiaceae bacterium]|jgi:Na+-translocating ferredoxin:NAD+ oxidoreductase RnfG subunit|nr:FMN-binding protein [Burkholderiaceae bacterium]